MFWQRLPASLGAGSGQVAFDPDQAEELGKQGKKVILVRTETTPDDIHGIVMAQGVLNKSRWNDNVTPLLLLVE